MRATAGFGPFVVCRTCLAARGAAGLRLSSTVKEGSRRFLSDAERIVIADGVQAGRSARAIAAELGRHPTTVSRELPSNRDAVSGEYRPYAAHRFALARRPRPKQRRTDSNDELCTVVQQRLDTRRVPGTDRWLVVLDYPSREDMRACHEAIYQAIYAPSSPLRRDDRPVLRSGRQHRRRPRNGARGKRFTEPMVNVRERSDRGDHAAHRLVGVQQDLTVVVAPDQSDGQPPAQLAEGGLVADPALQACSQDVQLGSLDRAMLKLLRSGCGQGCSRAGRSPAASPAPHEVRQAHRCSPTSRCASSMRHGDTTDGDWG